MTPVCASVPKSTGSLPPCRPLGNIRGNVRGPAMPSIHSFGCKSPLSRCQTATAWTKAASATPVSATPTFAWICLTISGV